MKKKVAIIGIVGLPAKYGGFETLVEYLTLYTNSFIDYSVFCSKKYYNIRLKEYNSSKLIYIPFNSNGLQSIFYDYFSILYSLFKTDILLILGFSMF